MTAEPTDTSDDGHVRLVRTALVILSSTALGFSFYFARPVLVPFIIALFISYILMPALDGLQSHARLPRLIAIAITIVGALLLISGFALLLYTALKDAAGEITFYQRKIPGLLAQLYHPLEQYLGKLDMKNLSSALDQVPVAAMIRNMVSNVTGLLSSTALVLIFVIYLLFARGSAQIKKDVFQEIDRKVKKYVSVKFLISLATGFMVGLTLWLLGLKLYFFFGIMAFLLNLIPNIGSIVATLLPLPVAAVQFDSGLKIMLVFLIPGAIQITVGNFIEPTLLGNRLGLHPITVLLSLVFWGLVWGIPGLFVAAPLTAVIKIVLEQSDQTEPLARIMAGNLQ